MSQNNLQETIEGILGMDTHSCCGYGYCNAIQEQKEKSKATEAILQAVRDTVIKVIDSFDGVPLKNSIKEQMLGDKETAEILVSMEASANTTLDVFKERLLKELGGGE